MENATNIEIEFERLKLSKAALIIDALGMVDQNSELVKNELGDINGTIVYPVVTIDGDARTTLINSLVDYLTK